MKTMINVIGVVMVVAGIFLPSVSVVGSMYSSLSFGVWFVSHLLVWSLMIGGGFILLCNYLWTKNYR